MRLKLSQLISRYWYGVARNLFLLPLVFLSYIAVVAGVTPLSEPIKPLPANPAARLPAEKIALGEKLFNDVRFSADDTVSCQTCHNVSVMGGADGKPVYIGVYGSVGPLNTPSVLNAAYNFRQFWDGRADTLENQVGVVIKNPLEMDSNWEQVLSKLSRDSTLVAEFKQIYSDGLTRENIEDAIATYQRSLPEPSRFDRYLNGEVDAITADEEKGYERFKQYGCIACHQGINVGGNMYQKFGVLGDYFADRGNIQTSDYGRFNQTDREQDRYVFKVPSLRNVAITAPYFHDGSVATLGEAVDVMFKYQLGRKADKEDKRLIIQFMRALTAESYESLLSKQ